MNKTDDTPRFLIGMVLHDLAAEAEGLVLLANAIEDRAVGVSTQARPQQLRETASLVKNAALQLGQGAANMVGISERLRLVAEFSEHADADHGELPS